MTATEGGAPRDRRKLIYIATLVVVLGLGVWGVVAFHSSVVGSQADSKAQQLKSRLESAGLPAPDTRVIADTLGTNGGMVCQDPTNPLIKANYQAAITNGAAGPGSRPVIGDNDIVEAVSLTIATYCPDQLGNWVKHVRDDLKLAA